jgi:hypothetical protein
VLVLVLVFNPRWSPSNVTSLLVPGQFLVSVDGVRAPVPVCASGTRCPGALFAASLSRCGVVASWSPVYADVDVARVGEYLLGRPKGELNLVVGVDVNFGPGMQASLQDLLSFVSGSPNVTYPAVVPPVGVASLVAGGLSCGPGCTLRGPAAPAVARDFWLGLPGIRTQGMEQACLVAPGLPMPPPLPLPSPVLVVTAAGLGPNATSTTMTSGSGGPFNASAPLPRVASTEGDLMTFTVSLGGPLQLPCGPTFVRAEWGPGVAAVGLEVDRPLQRFTGVAVNVSVTVGADGVVGPRPLLSFNLTLDSTDRAFDGLTVAMVLAVADADVGSSTSTATSTGTSTASRSLTATGSRSLTPSATATANATASATATTAASGTPSGTVSGSASAPASAAPSPTVTPLSTPGTAGSTPSSTPSSAPSSTPSGTPSEGPVGVASPSPSVQPVGTPSTQGTLTQTLTPTPALSPGPAAGSSTPTPAPPASASASPSASPSATPSGVLSVSLTGASVVDACDAVTLQVQVSGPGYVAGQGLASVEWAVTALNTEALTTSGALGAAAKLATGAVAPTLALPVEALAPGAKVNVSVRVVVLAGVATGTTPLFAWAALRKNKATAPVATLGLSLDGPGYRLAPVASRVVLSVSSVTNGIVGCVWSLNVTATEASSPVAVAWRLVSQALSLPASLVTPGYVAPPLVGLQSLYVRGGAGSRVVVFPPYALTAGVVFTLEAVLWRCDTSVGAFGGGGGGGGGGGTSGGGTGSAGGLGSGTSGTSGTTCSASWPTKTLLSSVRAVVETALAGVSAALVRTNLTVGLDASVKLDASPSTDGDGMVSLPFAYLWSCAPMGLPLGVSGSGPCMGPGSPGTPLALPQGPSPSPVLVLPPGSLAPGLYALTVVVTKGLPGALYPVHYRASNATATLSVLASSVPPAVGLGVMLPQGAAGPSGRPVVNSGDRVVVRGSAQAGVRGAHGLQLQLRVPWGWGCRSVGCR